MKKPEIVCDLNQKKWLNLQEAIAIWVLALKILFKAGEKVLEFTPKAIK
ncbi:hypothetical protein [Marinifilum fragile]|nr:hypothetical protein [Marinifilum fragile]